MVWIEKDLNIYHLVPTPAVAGTPPSRPGCSRHATAVITGPTGLLFPKFIFSPLGYGMSVQGTAQENKTSCQEVGVCGIDQDVTPGAVLSLLKTLQHIPYHCSDSVLEQLGAPWSVVMSSPCTRGFGCCKSRAGPPVILTVAHTWEEPGNARAWPTHCMGCTSNQLWNSLLLFKACRKYYRNSWKKPTLFSSAVAIELQQVQTEHFQDSEQSWLAEIATVLFGTCLFPCVEAAFFHSD